MDLAHGHGCSNFFRGKFIPLLYMFFPIDRYFTHIEERSILNSTNQCLSQDLETGCLKLAVVKP